MFYLKYRLQHFVKILNLHVDSRFSIDGILRKRLMGEWDVELVSEL